MKLKSKDSSDKECRKWTHTKKASKEDFCERCAKFMEEDAPKICIVCYMDLLHKNRKRARR